MRSGGTAKLSVGQEVPVAGAISQNANGGTLQSVEYRNSGVIFELKPTILEERIRIAFSQQISSFVKTDTGVNNSPTMIKREVRTDVDLQDGETFIVGGLIDSKESGTRTGLPFLPRWLNGKTSDAASSELMVLLQVNKIP